MDGPSGIGNVTNEIWVGQCPARKGEGISYIILASRAPGLESKAGRFRLVLGLSIRHDEWKEGSP